LSVSSELSEFMPEVCHTYYVHGHKHLDDDATDSGIKPSTIDWSNCAHSSIRRVL